MLAGDIDHAMGAKPTKGRSNDVLCVGATFPDATLYEAYPASETVSDLDELLRGKPVRLGPIFKNRKVIVLGAPGAFTPNCTQFHLPSYIERYNDFRASGADEIIVLCANDVFAAQGWMHALGGEGKIRPLSDPKAELAKRLGLDLDARNTVGRIVYKRFSAIVDDGVVKLLFVEPDGLGLQCTLAVPVLSKMSSAYAETGKLPVAS